jgi:hypothetical protein
VRSPRLNWLTFLDSGIWGRFSPILADIQSMGRFPFSLACVCLRDLRMETEVKPGPALEGGTDFHGVVRSSESPMVCEKQREWGMLGLVSRVLWRSFRSWNRLCL